ncbi:cleavage stimulating factor 64 isoform X2 [Impatiens glandulifera]|uniref:cleavage stimulating factor 64 isoform X2 n=1 Tax=Impatiens glandulifera TaxID=253017 RepID=UPI001FB0E1BC|nr:cleavage stimulating factor 64 isoform X2 [Impatiens glandulifera]
MANPSSQRRCVFVGNIPYDATEEQLVQICEEVGPVVSFRLVIDRETGKPKGYGFCEYKDEETALSARRNLQGYDINGRQLRVDFAENDKNAEKNKDPGHGGPGMATNVATVGDSSSHQPIGLQSAIAAASFMSNALGGAQTAKSLNQNGLQGPRGMFNDPLTLHLAKMSRNQLTGIMSELKAMAMNNKEQARQLLLNNPNFPKALFQAQIMLGMVSPQMLQMPNIRQSTPLTPSLPYDTQLGQQTRAQSLLGPQTVQNKLPLDFAPRVSEGAIPSVRPNILSQGQFSSFPQHQTPSQVQLPQVSQRILPGNPGLSSFTSARAPPLGVSTATSEIQSSSSVLPKTSTAAGAYGRQRYPGSISGLPDKEKRVMDALDPSNRPPKMIKLEGGDYLPSSAAGGSNSSSLSRPYLSGKQIPMPEAPQIPPEVESALLQQVLSLTQEQLNSLPPDQREQVIQLQKMLR